jgi:hypothetical protein
LGEEEPSMELQFIQYPKFPHEEAELKKELIIRTELMMIELEQKRVVIVFTDETIMLEQSDSIDPNILLILFKIIYFLGYCISEIFSKSQLYFITNTKSLNKLFN